MRRLGLLLALAACAEDPVVTPDAGSIPDALPSADASLAPDASLAADAAASDAAPSPDAASADASELPLVPVEHARELRGVWVASVSNLDFPRSQRLTPTEAQAALEDLVVRTASAGLNAVFFQVRPESDALYASSLEPWSRFLTGTQGTDPGYDPLATLLALARRYHLEVHAWINPYRGMSSASAQTAPNHVTRTLAAHAIPYNGQIVMDPSATAVREHVVAVVRELVERYDVDGVHFDDYFYPYPDSNGTPFPDGASYAAYTQGGGALSLGDWRRSNVNALVREISELTVALRPTLRFGVSPFGIYRNDVPPGIRGLDAYATIYCDSLAWMQNGWVDYLAPQLYWPTTQTRQAYGTLASWWASIATGGRHVFPGHALYQLGSSSAWTIGELEAQVDITRGLADQGAKGDLFFAYRHLAQDLLGVAGLFSRQLYARPAIPPPVPRALAAPAPPTLTPRPGGAGVEHPDRAALSALLLYRELGGRFELERVLDRDVSELNLEPGVWAVSAVGKGGHESAGRRIER